MRNTPHNVAVIGFGIIGQSWSICFARAGYTVRAFDPDQKAANAAMTSLCCVLRDLAARGLLRGQEPDRVAARISVASSLGEAVADAVHVQENTPEIASVKSRIFNDLDAATPSQAVIASSTSALLPSQFTDGLPGVARCLVVHPLNPPHLIPAVELVPAPKTAPDTITRTYDLMQEIGQNPIVANREIPGFIMNRLQGAMLDEAFALVDDGLCSVEDVDRAVRDGLARRWSFMGPFETIDLNAPGGVAGFIDRYRATYEEVGRSRPNRRLWTGALREKVIRARRAILPENRLPERQAWRDLQLARIAAHFRQDEPD